MAGPDNPLQSTEERITWVLTHPAMSPWLKAAIRSARDCDPIDVLNDLEFLNHLLRARCEARLHMAFETEIELAEG